MELTENKINLKSKSKVRRILIVDDERDAVDLLDLILTNEGYLVVKSFTAKEAMQILESRINLPDLILLDIRMPGKNGIEFCRELKKNKRYSKIPIVIISALSFPIDIEKGFTCGASDYILKPWNNDDLVARINIQLS